MRFPWLPPLLLSWLVFSAQAMTPGATLILQCPESGKFFSLSTIGSGNTFGGTIWSDGYAHFPMLPSTPEIGRCGEQGKFFWVAEAAVVGQFKPREHTNIPPEWRDAYQMGSLSAKGYLDALAEGVARNRKEELHLRKQAWWAANDRFRVPEIEIQRKRMSVEDFERRRANAAGTSKGASVPSDLPTTANRTKTVNPIPGPFPPGTTARDNLERIVDLLSLDDANERLQKAEALRELGRFEEAQQILQSPFPAQMQGVARQILELVEQGNTVVRELTTSRK